MWHPIVTLRSRAALSVRAGQRGCAALAGNIVLRSHAAWQPVASRWFLFTPHLLLDRGDFVKNSAFRRNMTQFLDNLPALWYCAGILYVSKRSVGRRDCVTQSCAEQRERETSTVDRPLIWRTVFGASSWRDLHYGWRGGSSTGVNHQILCGVVSRCIGCAQIVAAANSDHHSRVFILGVRRFLCRTNVFGHGSP